MHLKRFQTVQTYPKIMIFTGTVLLLYFERFCILEFQLWKPYTQMFICSNVNVYPVTEKYTFLTLPTYVFSEMVISAYSFVPLGVIAILLSFHLTKTCMNRVMLRSFKLNSGMSWTVIICSTLLGKGSDGAPLS